MTTWSYPFTPHAKQKRALQAGAREVLYGGAVAGGKSEVLLAACVDLCTLVPNAKALIVRRSRPELLELHERLRSRLPEFIATFSKQDGIYTFFNGAKLITRYLDSQEDATKVQGFEVQLACVERSTPVMMGDGTWRRIDTIAPGDLVQTMEGPRKVLRSMHMGTKPVYEVTTPHGSTKVAQGHPIYTPGGWVAPEVLKPTAPRIGQPSSATSVGSCPAVQRPCGCSSQGPAPAAAPGQACPGDNDHRGTCVCRECGPTCSAASGGCSRAAQRPQEWYAPVVLTSPPRLCTSSDDGDACAPGESRAPGSPCGCPTSPRSCGGRGTCGQEAAAHRSCTPSLDGAGARLGSCSSGGRGCTPARTQGWSETYTHPYTSEVRDIRVPVEAAWARMVPAGEAEVWDLEVESANHYVSWGHLTIRNCFDELTHYEKSWYSEVVSRLRATGQVKADMDKYGLQLRALSASNPGGRGHAWVKDRFVDPAPMGTEFVGDDGTDRLFIQATLYDNPYIDHEDYIRNSLGPLDPERRRALLEGDWTIPAGVRFPQFRESIHVIKPEDLPIDVIGHARVCGVDFGFNDPYAAVWMAKVHGVVVVYREDQATELTDEQQAQRVLALSDDGDLLHGDDLIVPLDEAAWRRSPKHVGSMPDNQAPLGSMARAYMDVLEGKGAHVVKATHGPGSRAHRWATLDRMLAVDETTGLPGILIYDNCRQLIRAIQSAPRDKRKPDDVDTHWKDDHILDALSYGYMELLGRDYHRPLSGHERLRLEGTNRSVTAGAQTVSF